MISRCVGLLIGITMVLLMELSSCCFAMDFCAPTAFAQPSGRCAPQQAKAPVARTVRLTVPVQQNSKACGPVGVGIPQRYCAPSPPVSVPHRTMPVRVDISVAPEESGQGPVPVVYRDPGFLRPIIGHSVGLIGAAVAAPFRVAEMLFPSPGKGCPPKQCCGPAPGRTNCNYGPQVIPHAGGCFPPVQSQGCIPSGAFGCAPPGPRVAPLPPCPSIPRCGPNLPPALVEEYMFPAREQQDLISGIWNLPGTIIRTGRFSGDIGRTAPCGTPTGW